MKTTKVKALIAAMIHELQAAWNQTGDYYALESKVLDGMLDEYQKTRFQSEEIARFAQLGVHIGIHPDYFKEVESTPNYRGYIYWKENGKWIEEDILTPDWEETLGKCLDFAAHLEKNHFKILK